MKMKSLASTLMILGVIFMAYCPYHDYAVYLGVIFILSSFAAFEKYIKQLIEKSYGLRAVPQKTNTNQ